MISGGRAARPRLWALLWWAALAVSLGLCSAGARADDGKRPRLFLIVCDALTLDDFDLRGASCPDLAYLAEHGTLGLMNCAVAGPKTDTAALIAIAAGQLAPAEETDEMAANDWEKALGERISAAESHRLRLGIPPATTDVFDPHNSVKHLGIIELRKRGLDTTRLGALLAGASPPVTTWIVGNADTIAWRRRAALLTVDKLGVGAGLVALRSYDARMPYGLSDSPQALAEYALQSRADFVVIHLGDGSRAEAARDKLSESEYRTAHGLVPRALNTLVALLRTRLSPASANILIVSPRPPAGDATHPEAWNQLTPIVGFGPDFPAGAFASATTRTPGLIGNTDVAPTILSLYRQPSPPTMTGRPMWIVPDPPNDPDGARRIKRIARLNFIAWINATALAPVLAILAVLCFACGAAGLLALRRRKPAIAAVFAAGLAAAMNFPAAQLFAPISITPTVVEYGLRIGAWMLGLTLISYVLARILRVSTPVAACLLNIASVLVDLLTGQHLLKDALISNYYVPGFRYYGLGNDYLGLILGLSIAGAFSLVDDVEQRAPAAEDEAARSQQPGTAPNGPAVEEDQAPVEREKPAGETEQFANGEEPGAIETLVAGRGWQWTVGDRLAPGILLAWAALAFILGWPAWGANAGSIVVTCAAFGAGWRILRGGRWAWLAAVVFTLAGVGISFGFAYLDARLHGAQSAHAGAALRTAGVLKDPHAAGRGVHYLWTIVQRKLLLNLSLFAAPWTWVAASVTAGGLLLTSIIGEDEIYKALRRRTWLTRSFGAVFVAALASMLFKDTGVVTVFYLAGSVLLVGFWYVLAPDSPAWLQRRSERN